MEFARDCFQGEVPVEGAQDIGEHKGDIMGQGFREHGGQGGQCIVSANGDTRDGTIGEDKNGSDRVYVLLDLGRNTPLVELVLLNTPSVGQPRGVEDANLGKRLYTTHPPHPKVPALTIIPFLLVNS